MAKRKGVNAAAWFYAQPGFRTAAPVVPEVTVTGSCANCGYHVSWHGPEGERSPLACADYVPATRCARCSGTVCYCDRLSK